MFILSDTRNLDDIAHWKHTARWIVERTAYVGPNGDKWFALFIPSNLFPCHFVWTATYILKAFVPFLPNTDLVLLDHDAAFTTLFENGQLTNLALNLHLPYRRVIRHLGLLIITEPGSNANAGVVWFPRNKLAPAADASLRFAIKAKEAFAKNTPTPEIVDMALELLKHKKAAFLQRKLQPPPSFLPQP